MKVPGSDGSSNSLPRIKEGVGDSRSTMRRGVGEANAQPTGLLGEISRKDSDTVTFSPLSARIRAELNPANMVDERRSTIERLKQQVANDTYAPPLKSVARSVSEEISFEVLLANAMK